MKVSASTLKALGFSFIAAEGGIEEYRLDGNGLKVLLAENHSKPVHTFMTLFHVGSRNEGVGYTGSTHFLEHMMFKGTPKHNPQDGNGVFETFKPLGNTLNATTSLDRTNYFECVPSTPGNLRTCIALEADRMRNLNIKQEDRESEMTVVRNELELGRNNLDRVMSQEAFSVAFREHPYHHPTIGWVSDVENVPIERLKEFYDTFYWPNNCTVMCVGDFDSTEALGLIAEHFGPIPSSPAPIPEVYTTEPEQKGERRFEVERIGNDNPMVLLAYHTPEGTHPDAYVVDMLCKVLGDQRDKTSVLYKHMIASGLASETSAGSWTLHDPTLLFVDAKANPGVTHDQIETALYAAIESILIDGVAADKIARLKRANRKGSVLSAGDPMSYCSMIASAESIDTWKWLVEFDDKFDAITAEDIYRVIRKYLVKRNRTVGYLVPVAPEAAAEVSDEAVATDGGAAEVVAEKSADTGSKTASFTEQSTKFTLANGLRVVVLPNPGSGAVSFAGAIKAGQVYRDGKSEAHYFVPQLLTAGTATRSQLEISEALTDMCANLRFGATSTDVAFGTQVVKEDAQAFAELLADVIRHPAFPEHPFNLVKATLLAEVTDQVNTPSEVAENTLYGILYGPDAPQAQKPLAQLGKSVEGTTLDDVKQFHADHFTPKGTIITVVGDIDVETARSIIEGAFGDWTGEDVRALPEPKPHYAMVTSHRIDRKMVGKDNVDIAIGLPVPVLRSAADFATAHLANVALGGDTIGSRLGKVVRVKHGLTYGITSRYDNPAIVNSPWMVTLTVNPKNIDKALGLIKEVVDQYKAEGISDEELADNAASIANGFMVRLRSDLSVAQTIATFESLGIGTEGMDAYPQQLAAVTKEQVNEAIRKYFRLEDAFTVLAGTY